MRMEMRLLRREDTREVERKEERQEDREWLVGMIREIADEERKRDAEEAKVVVVEEASLVLLCCVGRKILVPWGVGRRWKVCGFLFYHSCMV